MLCLFVKNFSGAMKRRLNIIASMLHDPIERHLAAGG